MSVFFKFAEYIPVLHISRSNYIKDFWKEFIVVSVPSCMLAVL